jgi:MFS family permease
LPESRRQSAVDARPDALPLEPEHAEQQRLNVLDVCPSISVACFYACSFVFGAGVSIVSNFLFMYLLSLGASFFLLGLTVLVTIVVEIPVFYFSSKLLAKIGIKGMVITAFVAYVTRVFLYTQLTRERVWLVLPVELLHGLTYAMIYPAGVAFASASVDERLQATAQGLYSAVFGGLGGGAGALVGGAVYQAFGPRRLFQGMGVINGVNLLIFLLIYRPPKPKNRGVISNESGKAIDAQVGGSESSAVPAETGAVPGAVPDDRGAQRYTMLFVRRSSFQQS